MTYVSVSELINPVKVELLDGEVVNLTQAVKAERITMTLGQLHALHQMGKIAYDRQRLQRLLNRWSNAKINSYLTTIINGCAKANTFQLARLDLIVKDLRRLEAAATTNLNFIRENLEYFQNFLNDGFQYICIDGQHRIDGQSLYISGEHFLSPTSKIEMKIGGENGVCVVDGNFTKLPEAIQKYINDIEVSVVIYETGDLKILAQIFITSNLNQPFTRHEIRIINHNPICRYLVDLCEHENLQQMFKHTGSMTKEYAIERKGDTLFCAEMLAYLHDNTYEHDHNVLDDMLGANPTPENIPYKSDQLLLKKILYLMADGCAHMTKAELERFTRPSKYNLFITLSFLLQKGNKFSSRVCIDNEYAIAKPKEFIDWFNEKEYDRLNLPGGKTIIEKQSAKGKKPRKIAVIHPWSFESHNRDQKHSSKVCEKGEGGSPYTFDDYARIRWLLADLVKDLTLLVNAGIIQKVGDRNAISLKEARRLVGMKFRDLKNCVVDEKDPISKGGSRVPGNIRKLEKKKNNRKSNKAASVNV